MSSVLESGFSWELFTGRQVAILVHDLQRVVNHRSPVALNDVGGHVCVTEVEVGLEDNNDLFDGGVSGQAEPYE